MHEEGVSKLLIIAGKHMQHCGLPLFRMPREVKVSVIANTATYPNKLMFGAYALGNAYQGISVVVKVAHSLCGVGNFASIAVVYQTDICMVDQTDLDATIDPLALHLQEQSRVFW
jgi:hypothetical protein